MSNWPVRPPAAVRTVYWVSAAKPVPSSPGVSGRMEISAPGSIVTVPEASSRSLCPAALTSTAKVEPASKVTSTACVVPIEPPGARVAPFMTVTAARRPVPPSTPPLNSTLPSIWPLTSMVPPIRRVPPLCCRVPVKTVEPAWCSITPPPVTSAAKL